MQATLRDSGTRAGMMPTSRLNPCRRPPRDVTSPEPIISALPRIVLSMYFSKSSNIIVESQRVNSIDYRAHQVKTTRYHAQNHEFKGAESN